MTDSEPVYFTLSLDSLRAIAHAPAEVREVLEQMPAREAGRTRWATLLHMIDAGVRAGTS